MTTDIFIKTYYKDFCWLEYALKSIKKFGSGFRSIVIVTDEGHTIPSEILDIMPVKVFYVPLPKKQPSYVEHGLGYLWQQYIKLTWYNYTDADNVYIVDSDQMFSTPTTPEHFKTDGKFHWVYQDWAKAGTCICWKESTDKLIGRPTIYDSMCAFGFILQRDTTIALRNFLLSTHGGTDIWDILCSKNMKTCSEFNIFGSFIDIYDRQEYTKLINIDTSSIHNSTIITDWSWGSLNSDIKVRRDKILLD